MNRVRAADDFEAIRVRLNELRREREQQYGAESPAAKPLAEKPLREPDAVAHVPRHLLKRYLSSTR
ncbi:MAG TPA: hypothetical protein VFQ90_11965 [Stellaceae bacterium]|jgi:hypothetical protein|nr:hypothetical protein [Stellaceae bacterium]